MCSFPHIHPTTFCFVLIFFPVRRPPDPLVTAPQGRCLQPPPSAQLMDPPPPTQPTPPPTAPPTATAESEPGRTLASRVCNNHNTESNTPRTNKPRRVNPPRKPKPRRTNAYKLNKASKTAQKAEQKQTIKRALPRYEDTSPDEQRSTAHRRHVWPALG